MSAYRQNNDPNVDEELHALDVSTAKGGALVGVLGAVAICFAVAAVVFYFGDAPPEMQNVEIGCGVAAVAFAVQAWFFHSKRRRHLRIVRHGEHVRLEVASDGVLLDLPLVLHGMQMRSPVGRTSMTEVYLQLVDAKGRAVMLRETRGAAYGRYETWFPDDIDRSVRSTRYDLGGLNTAANVRSWIETLHLQLKGRDGDLP